MQKNTQIFKKHPNVEKAYNKFVIERRDKTQAEFWKEYFEAKMFYENKTKRDLLASVSAKKQASAGFGAAEGEDGGSGDSSSSSFTDGTPGASTGICSEINAKSFRMARVHDDSIGGSGSSKDANPYRRESPAQPSPEKRGSEAKEALPRKLMRLPRQTEYSLLDAPSGEEGNTGNEEGTGSRIFEESRNGPPSEGRAEFGAAKGAQDFQNLVKESVRIGRRDDFSALALCPEYDFVRRECDKVHSLCTEVWSRVPSSTPEDERVVRIKLDHMQELATALERMAATAAARKATTPNKDEMIEGLNGLCGLLRHTISKVKQIKNF